MHLQEKLDYIKAFTLLAANWTIKPMLGSVMTSSDIGLSEITTGFTTVLQIFVTITTLYWTILKIKKEKKDAVK